MNIKDIKVEDVANTMKDVSFGVLTVACKTITCLCNGLLDVINEMKSK